MARPDKQGLDYYPKDIDADRDDKLSMIIGEFGSKGEMLFDKLCGWIYKHKGYFIEWDEKEQLKFLSRYSYCGFSVSFLNEVVQRFIKWGLFDETVFNTFQILTSIRIQKTWVDASRKRTGRKIIQNIWLIEVSSGLAAEEISKKAEETTQSKVKESKEEKSKVKRANALVVAGATTDAIAKEQKEKWKNVVEQLTGNDLITVWVGIKNFIQEEKPCFIDPYIEAWNLFASKYKLSKIEAISESRKKKFKTRMDESSFDFLTILEKIKVSQFLLGKTSNWMVDWDWIFENDTNYLKIIEGGYN